MGLESLMKTVWIYVDTSKQVGDRDHLKVFANSDLADEWFVVNDPEGVDQLAIMQSEPQI